MAPAPGSSVMNNSRLAWTWIPAELLLVATTVAGVLMLERVFADDAYLSPLLFGVVITHGILIALRWFGFSAAVAAAGSLVGTAVTLVAVHYSNSAFAAVVPSGATIDQIRIDLTAARDVFETIKAPVPSVTGFLVFAALAFWVAAVIADWSAFRLKAPGQALLPMLALLVFVSLLGVDDRRIATTSTLVICGVLFVLACRSAQRASTGTWLGRGSAQGYNALMATGALVAILAIVGGVAGGPLVPGADEAPLVEIGENSQEDTKPLEVISPLVQIQPRLLNQSDRVMFTVDTDQPQYWRIAVLDYFDGFLWRSNGSYEPARGELPAAYESQGPSNISTQTFNVSALNAIWAPAAYRPVAFNNMTSIGVGYEAESATLIVDVDDQEVSDGLRYEVTSEIPSFTPELLIELPKSNDDNLDDRYLQMPDDFSPEAAAIAAELTAGIEEPYLQALTLQNWFHENFVYDIDVADGHNIERIEDFLEVRRGYCEQFATTYTAMARSIGLPARVAQGFTMGDLDPTTPGRYIVRGKHAHTWPEVYIDGAGWVAFEPTPGRGAPNASQYTGIAEAQDSAPVEQQSPEQESSNPNDQAAAEQQEAGAPDAEPTPTPEESQAEGDEDTQEAVGQPSSFPWRILVFALVLIAAAIAWVFGIPALKRRQVAGRRDRLGDANRRRIALAWAETVDILEHRGLGPATPETLLEYAARVENTARLPQGSFMALTTAAVDSAYRSNEPSSSQAEDAERQANAIQAHLIDGQPWVNRQAEILDPRPLLRGSDTIVGRARELADGAVSANEVRSASQTADRAGQVP